jgi:serine carboxypeptidase-like clade 2
LPSLISYGLQVYYYSGDFDGMVPIQGTFYWLKKFRSDYGASVKKSWRPWTFDKKVYSGMLWQLDGIVFWSIAGSGGMAAIDKPEQVKVVLDVFLGQKSIDSV